jgi:enoyl-CoA hydratase/carnithine racemase
MNAEPVLYEVRDHVALLTWNRPAKKNAFDGALWRAATAALERAKADPAVRVVVATGAGGNFSAGVDLSDLANAAGSGPGPGAGRAASAGAAAHPAQAMMELLCRFEKPLVAAADGVGVGIGLTFLLHCDFAYVSDRVRLRAPFVRLGVVPEAGSSVLFPLILGWRNAIEVVFGAEFIDGPRAVALGIANACVPAERLLDTALERARALARQAPRALQATKRLLLEARRDQVQAGLARENRAFAKLLGGPETLEAFRAFAERREPDFSRLEEA